MRFSASCLAKRLFAPLLMLMLCSCATLETQRNVYVNGERQNALGVALLDQQARTRLPDGRYWLNAVTGDFGVEGKKQPLGNLHAGSTAKQATRSKTSGGGAGSGRGAVSNSVNGTAGTGRDAEGRNCAFVSIPNGAGVMTCN